MRISSYDGQVAWIPAGEAAAMLKVSRQRVYQLIEQGSVMAIKRGPTWLVNHRSVMARIALLMKEGGD